MTGYRRAFVAVGAALGLSFLGAGAAETAVAADPAPASAFAPVRLFPLSALAITQCHLARASGVRLCPRRLPRAFIAYRRGVAPPALSAERFGPSRNGSAVEVGMSFSYGAPWEPESGPDWRRHLWRNRPCCFLHFELWRTLSGVPPFPESARPAVVGGHRGDLALAGSPGTACGAGNTGVYFCNHLRFRWQEGATWYVATLHDFGSGATRALLDRIIRQLRPAGTLRPAQTAAST